jgi:hypothetical protein
VGEGTEVCAGATGKGRDGDGSEEYGEGTEERDIASKGVGGGGVPARKSPMLFNHAAMGEWLWKTTRPLPGLTIMIVSDISFLEGRYRTLLKRRGVSQRFPNP